MSNNDWLKYNASEYTVNGKTYRNLEAQVLKNMEDIADLDISGIEQDITDLQTGKQDKLTAGANITIDAENEISATDTTYTGGSGIQITGTTINAKPRFYVTPGTTTFAQIEAAYYAGLVIMCDGGVASTDLPLAHFGGSSFIFAGLSMPALSPTSAYFYKVVQINADDTYSEQLFTRTTSKTGITSSATTTQMPTTKAVYDYITDEVHQIPAGGTTGQALCKTSGTDYDVSWQTVSGGGGTPEVLWCTTSTTYAEITAALAAQQLPVLYAIARIYTYLEDPTTSSYRFVAVDPSTMDIRYYDVNTSNTWTAYTKHISELQKHTTTVSIASTDWQSAGGGTYYDVAVTVTGMTASATTWVSPDPSSAYDYADAGIICSAQASNSLTFRTKGTDAPSGSISVNVVWLT